MKTIVLKAAPALVFLGIALTQLTKDSEWQIFHLLSWALVTVAVVLCGVKIATDERRPKLGKFIFFGGSLIALIISLLQYYRVL